MIQINVAGMPKREVANVRDSWMLSHYTKSVFPAFAAFLAGR
jgi:hypothetical protein